MKSSSYMPHGHESGIETIDIAKGLVYITIDNIGGVFEAYMDTFPQICAGHAGGRLVRIE